MVALVVVEGATAVPLRCGIRKGVYRTSVTVWESHSCGSEILAPCACEERHGRGFFRRRSSLQQGWSNFPNLGRFGWLFVCDNNLKKLLITCRSSRRSECHEPAHWAAIQYKFYSTQTLRRPEMKVSGTDIFLPNLPCSHQKQRDSDSGEA